MQFATYQEFRVTVQRLIDGDDVLSNLSPDTLDTIIALGEVRVYRELRASTMEATLAATVTANAAPLPADCIALKIVWFDPADPLRIVTEEDLRQRSEWTATGGQVRLCAEAGTNVIFAPAAADATTLAGRYYQRHPDIKTALNATFNRYPEVFVYAALCESAPFLGEESRMQMWESIYGRLLGSANTNEIHRTKSGSHLRQVSR